MMWLYSMLVCLSIISPISPDCSDENEKVDLFFVLDGSVSVDPHRDFQMQKNLAKNIISIYITPQTRVSVTVFNDIVHHVIPLHFLSGDSYDTFNLLNDIDHIKHLGGNTAIGDAISSMRREARMNPSGHRHMMGFIMTDGISRDVYHTREESKMAREEGFDMYAIGVGKYVNKEELTHIGNDVGKDGSEYVFIGDGDEALEFVRQALALRGCHDSIGQERPPRH